MITIIIPMYNSSRTILSLLESIEKQDFRDLEVIIVDDCSTDDSLNKVKCFKGSIKMDVLTIPENCGPAAARNFGALKARGDVLFFLDSDLFLEEGALRNVHNFFQDPNAKCMIGVYSKIPAEEGSLASYKSLQNYYYYTASDIEKVSFFWGGIGAVRKEVFQEVGDFDTSYKGADYEDYEFGLRVLKKYPIHLVRNVKLRHYFSNSLWKNFNDHFRRVRMWLDIFMKERRFDNYVTTSSHGAGKASGFLAILVLPLGILSSYFLVLSLLFFSLFFYLNRKFFYLVFKEKGFVFFLLTILYDLVFSIALSLGIGMEIWIRFIRYVKRIFVK